MSEKVVYLAGPITGLTFAGCTDWRNFAREQLAQAGIKGLSPMRGKEYLEAIARDTPFTADGDRYAIQGPLSTNRGIMTRDRYDALRCDVLLVNLLGAGQVSIGTVMEIAWADSRRTPIVCAMEKEGNVHHHGMILEALGYRVPSLEEAIHICKAILS
jgi:nucleoside 2-deoxyribosyltransferase